MPEKKKAPMRTNWITGLSYSYVGADWSTIYSGFKESVPINYNSQLLHIGLCADRIGLEKPNTFMALRERGSVSFCWYFSNAVIGWILINACEINLISSFFIINYFWQPYPRLCVMLKGKLCISVWTYSKLQRRHFQRWDDYWYDGTQFCHA